MRAAWLVLLLLPSWATAAADPAGIASAREVIEQCKSTEKSGHGLAELRATCPQIETAADALGLDPVLPRDWRQRVDAYALADLAAAAQRYAAPAPHAPPDAAKLRALAQALAPRTQSVSWWDRLLAWLRQWLASTGSKWSWWSNLHWPWHWSLSPTVLTRIYYALGSLVVLAAIVVAAIEIRAARNPGGRRRLLRLPGIADSAPLPDTGPSLEMIAAATADQQPVLALRLLVSALVRSQRLAQDRNLTCRELATVARFDAPAQQAQFQSLALSAEHALYAERGQRIPGDAPAVVAAAVHPDRMDLEAVRHLYCALLAPEHGARSAP